MAASAQHVGLTLPGERLPSGGPLFAYFQKAFFKYLRNNEQTLSPGAAALQKLLRGEYLSIEERALFQLSPGESWVVIKLREARGKKAFPRNYMYIYTGRSAP